MSLESRSYSYYSDDSKGLWNSVPGHRDKSLIHVPPVLMVPWFKPSYGGPSTQSKGELPSGLPGPA